MGVAMEGAWAFRGPFCLPIPHLQLVNLGCAPISLGKSVEKENEIGRQERGGRGLAVFAFLSPGEECGSGKEVERAAPCPSSVTSPSLHNGTSPHAAQDWEAGWGGG